MKLIDHIQKFVPRFRGECMVCNKDSFIIRLYYQMRYYYYRNRTISFLRKHITRLSYYFRKEKYRKLFKEIGVRKWKECHINAEDVKE